MKKLIFPIIVILFAIIISLLFLIFTAEKNPFASNNNKNPISYNVSKTDNSLNNNPDSDFQNNSSPSSVSSNSGGGSGNSGGAGGSGGSGSNSGSLTPSCSQSQISYAMKNFVENLECLSSSNGICTNKKLSCSIKVENLDSEVSGVFSIKTLVLNKNTLEIVQEFVESKTIYPKTQETFSNSLSFQSQTEDGEANKDYDCSFRTLEIPKKADC